MNDKTEQRKAEYKKRIDEMFERARNIQSGQVDAFIAEMMSQPQDYNTVVETVAACAIAAARAADRSEYGGITGFQAGGVMWRFIQRWLSIEGPMKLVRYEDMLFPQYENQYTSIGKDTWTWVQEQAKKKLQEHPEVHPKVLSHWKSIVAGTVPFGYKVDPES